MGSCRAVGRDTPRPLRDPGKPERHAKPTAFALGQLVGSGHLTDDDVRQALYDAGIACGLNAREIRSTVGSGLAAGVRLPRHPRVPDLPPQ